MSLKSQNPLLTVFIPAYNEEKNLKTCTDALLRQFAEYEIDFEVVIVNDGSTDGTGTLAEQISASHSNIRVVHHKKNLGIGGAFRTAVSEASGEWLILIPADLALEPSELRHYLQAATNADVVVGLRSDRSDYTLARQIISNVNIALIRLLFGMKERQFQYISMYRTAVLHNMEIEYWHSAFFLAEILIKARDMGKRLVEVEIKYVPRINGQATGAKFKLVMLTILDLFLFWFRWIGRKARRTPQLNGQN
jgi:glycosyltransferase involved in cell wall biosynthesis